MSETPTTAIEPAKPPTAAVQYRTRVEQLSVDYLRTMLGSTAAQEAAGRVALAFRTAALKEPKLYAIAPEQVARAIALCAMTGLMPSGPLPEVELIPRIVQGNQQLDWQVTARGWRKLAERAGWTLDAVPVFAGEVFRAPRGLHGDIVHEPNYDEDPSYDRLRLFYVTAERPGDRARFRVITKSQIEERRRKAQTDAVWRQWPLEMAEKTAIAYAVRRGIVPLDAVGVVPDEEDDDTPQVIQAVPASAPQLPGPVAQPTRGLAGLAAALDDTEPAPPVVTSGGSGGGGGGYAVTNTGNGTVSPPPSPQVASSSAPPEQTAAPASGGGQAAAPTRGGPSKAERAQAEDDAKKLAARLVTKAPGSKVLLVDARAMLREAQSVNRVSDDRYNRALDAGAAAGLWTRAPDGIVLPAAPNGSTVTAPPEPTKDRWTDLADEALLDAVHGTAIRVGDQGSERAKVAAGMGDWAESDIVDNASDEQLRLLGRALDREEAALRADAERAVQS